MKTITYITIFLLYTTTMLAQGPVFEWAGQIANGEREMDSYAMTVDGSGSVITMGYFLGTLDVDPGPSEYFLETGLSYTDIFVQKLDSLGHFQWGVQFGGDLPDGSNATPLPFATRLPAGGAVKTDTEGNVFVIAEFMSDSIDADPGPDVSYIYRSSPSTESLWAHDYLVIKLDADGNYQWGHSFGGLFDENIDDADVDEDGNLYVVGSFQDSVDFDPSPTNEVWLTANGPIVNLTQVAGFIQKLDSNGDLLWVKQMGSNDGIAIPSDIEIDASGNLHMVGELIGTFDFDMGAGVFEMTEIADTVSLRTFVLKLDAEANFIWGQQFPGWGSGSSITIDSGGNIAVACAFYEGLATVVIDINPSPTEQLLVSSVENNGFYIVKLDADGFFFWGGDLAIPKLYEIQFDASGGLILSIEINDTVDVDPGIDSFLLAQPSEDFPFQYASVMVVLRLDNTAALDWISVVGPLKSYAQEQSPMETDDYNNIYISSGFVGTVDLNPSPVDTFNIVWSGNSNYDHDIFVLKWSQPDLLITRIDEAYGFEINVYPNPSLGQFAVNLHDTYENVDYQIIDHTGRVVQTDQQSSVQHLEILLDVPSGIYLFVLNVDSNTSTLPIIIQ